MTTTLEHLSNIPAELREPAVWLQYYLKPDPKHPDKKPSKCPTVKYSTPELRAANLRPLDKLLTRPKQAGFQRWIGKNEGFVFVDLDRVRNADTGEVEPWAEALIEQLDSYTEVSASGRGFHIVCRGNLPEDFHVDPNPVEIYSGNIPNKLLAMTGDVYELKMCVNDRQEQLEQLLRKMKSGATTPKVEQVAPGKRKELEAELDALSLRLIDTVATNEEIREIVSLTQALKELEPAPPTVPKTWRDAFHTGSELGSTPGKVFIKGILEEGITYFGALSGTGKTWIGLSIAHALLSGQPLFGVYPVLNKANVLYLVPEMGGNKFRERLVRMRISLDGGFFCQTIKDGACDLEDPLLLQAVKDTQGIVILDTAIRFQHGDEQSSTEQAQGLGAKMFKLIAAGAPAIICMHHRSKDRKDKEPSLENTLRGTGDFGAQADCVWCVEHSRKRLTPSKWNEEYEEESRQLTRLTLTCTKPRDMEPADPFTIQGRPYINEKGDFVVLESGGSDDPAETKEVAVNSDKVQAMIEKVKANPKTSSRELRKDTGFGLARVKNSMAGRGWVQEDGIWVNKSTTIFDAVESEPL
jgi:AAA domain-containing protein